MEVNVYFNGPATEIDMGPREFSVIPATGPAGADGQPGRDGTIENLSAAATTLAPGSQATARYENNLLTIGVPKGPKGDPGDDGQDGVGVPSGGTTGQVLKKKSGTDYDTEWANESGGGGGGTWGSITGTLSDQTDLQTALDEKAKKAINFDYTMSFPLSVGTWSNAAVNAGETSGGSCYYRVVDTSKVSNVTIYHKFFCSFLIGFSGVVYITPQNGSIRIETAEQPASTYRIVGTFVEGTPNTSVLTTKIIASVSGLTNDAGYITATTYSTGEVATGDTWVDGKPIYRYVLSNVSITTGTSVTIGTLPSLPDVVINIRGSLRISSGTIRPLSYCPDFGATYTAWYTIDYATGEIKSIFGSQSQGATVVYNMIIEYTKATT